MKDIKCRSRDDLVASLPDHGSALAFFCIYPERLRRQVRQVMDHLPDPFYAVKANMRPEVLQVLIEEGLRKFEFSSVSELEAARNACAEPELAYMNPVKQHGDIAHAYRTGVRTYVLDSADELEKILRATNGAVGCTLIIRIALAPKNSGYDMSGKFGAESADAVLLVQEVNRLGRKAGITFHVGSQCNEPLAFVEAIDEAAQVVESAGVDLTVLDVGGGFPAAYTATERSLKVFGNAIREAFEFRRACFGDACRLRSEPGRSLVAEAGSVLVRVELRRGNTLHLNEGIHGLLSELRWFPGMHPVRLVSRKYASDVDFADFCLAGPTCDSQDLMRGPYRLPVDMRRGDWIEIGFLGAYCTELVTPFNGFGRYEVAILQGEPGWQ